MIYKDYNDWLEVNKDMFKNHRVFKYKKDNNDWSFRYQIGTPDEKDNNRKNGWMNFQFLDGFLTITGDYGNAIFTWYDRELSFDWVANITSINYFIEKCLINDSSERWDSELARQVIQEHIFNNYIDIDDDWENYLESKTEWRYYLINNYYELYDYEYELYDAGVYIHERIYLWKRAIECANEYINKNNIK